MFVKSAADCEALTANDGCRIFELLHPKNESIELPYSFAVAEVAAGEASYRHRLRQDEVYFLLDGAGVMHIDAEHRVVETGDLVHIPAGAVQWIENPHPDTLRFIAIVSPPWNAQDDERL